jgi:glycosyltransferase involved in cell wall biosynthesis
VLRAIQVVVDEGLARPILVGRPAILARRIERYYGRSAEIVHPPVDVDHFLGLEREPRDYYLAFGRVVPYKRVDLAVAACARLGRQLKVAGDGRAFKRCRIVVDAQDPNSPPKVIYRQDLTQLGWPLLPDILTKLRAGVPIEQIVPAQTITQETIR